MEQVPAIVSVVFMITTFVTVGIFLSAVRSAAERSAFAKAVLFLVPFWLLLQFILGTSGFFLSTESLPPRIFAFGVGPALLLIVIAMVAARRNFISALPLGVLTIVHIIRIPVEITLAWLYEAGAVPRIMTFHGTNFDIISGITAPIAFYFAVRQTAASRGFLIVWNLICLGLLINIVTTAVLCIPSPFQRLAFDQPNIAVLHFPYNWLPAVVVPIVLFSHLASLYKLIAKDRI